MITTAHLAAVWPALFVLTGSFVHAMAPPTRSTGVRKLAPPPSTCALIIKSTAVDAQGVPFAHTALCSADVISANHAVTAAHCYNRDLHEGRRMVDITEQTLFCASTNRTYRLHRTPVVHPGYREDDPSRAFDVAVVTAGEPFNVKPVELPHYSLETYLLARANQCVLAGYQTDADFTKFIPHAEKNPNFASSSGVAKLSQAAVALGKEPLSETKLYSFGTIAINPGDSGGGVLCKNLAGDWIRIGTIDSIRKSNEVRLVAFESTFADREFLLPFTDVKTAADYARSYVRELSARGDVAADLELDHQETLSKWDEIWTRPDQTLGGLATPDDKDGLLMPLWEDLSASIKQLGWVDFVQ